MTSAKSISSMRWTSTHAATPAIDSHTTGRNRLRTCLGTLGIRSTYNPLMSLFANLVGRLAACRRNVRAAGQGP